MPAPLNTVPGNTPGAAPGFTVDGAGNEAITGALTVGKNIVLVAGAAPIQTPGALTLYTTDGATLSGVSGAGPAMNAPAGAIPLSTVTAKGDLIAGTGNAAVARLAVGSDGQVLTAASGQPDGMQWSTPSAGTTTWTNYTPALTNVTLGNGLLAAQYFQQGKFCTVAATLTFGSTSSVSGTIGLSLPFTAAAFANNGTWAGIAWGSAAASNPRIGVVIIFGGSTVMNANSDNGVSWNATTPGTWAANDHLTFTVTYQTV